MSYYAFYDTEGRITGMMMTTSRKVVESQPGSFITCDANVSDVTHWVDLSTGGAVTKPRSPFDPTHTISGLAVTFSALPAGGLVRVAGSVITVDDKPTEIEFELPGTYTVKLSGLVEYLDEKLEVTVG